MNIINKVTLRHLKENKRRTLVTIVGVIISVAMIMAVSTLAVSFQDLLIRQQIANQGEWHVLFKDTNGKQAQSIKGNEAIKTLAVSKSEGYARLPDSKERPYLHVQRFDENGLKQFPVTALKGRLPAAENELILSQRALDSGGFTANVGDTVTLELGTRMRDGKVQTQSDTLVIGGDGPAETLEEITPKIYTIVGIMEHPSWEGYFAPGYTALGYVELSSLTDEEVFDSIAVFKNVNRSMLDRSLAIAKENDIKKVEHNRDLLRYYGVSGNEHVTTTLYSLAGIIMLVILVGAVSLIYNAFAISVSERSRHLGMLASVGATKRQKRNSVFFEGAVIGLISIPLGILAGLAGIGTTFLFLNSFIEGALNITQKLHLVVTPMSLAAAVLISILTIFVSTYLPARRASKIAAIDAIRQSHDIKLTGKKIKTSKLVRNIFGMEAEIGLKNLKRNRKRYRATLFSLIISIVLFLSVSFFTQNLERSADMSEANLSYDIQIYGNNKGGLEEIIPLTNVEGVTESSLLQTMYLNTRVELEKLPPLLRENAEGDSSLTEDGYLYGIELYGLERNNFISYAEEVGADTGDFLDTANVPAIVIDSTSFQDYESRKIIESKTILAKEGEKLDVYYVSDDDGTEQMLSKIEIKKMTNVLPMGAFGGGLGNLQIIVPDYVFQTLINSGTEKLVQNYAYMNSSDPMKTQDVLNEAKPSNVYIYNVHEQRQRSQQMILFMSVFTYGFIALISLISIANILNTISTSIALRKREFAMLRSVGMTPKGFNKMINYESFFYGSNALLYGLPISLVIMYLIHLSLNNTFEYQFQLPIKSILFVVLALFLIVGAAMLYSIGKIKKGNIIDGLKQENV
ncbi:FtsX-like permease family protein [Bacillus lacus]|uniref:FtsX-like permease family protein n=1 Tax=Metabacillus lacus TaxID=1983721 RepID=A0A7X2J2H5_9BACI|nr:FtsX-like permease family protein [Metabacillus lacus]MRX74266.1 FtsX-like permease family protein [Metabacillus lacus]